jgi:gliding motility-associated-like protein
MKKLCLLSTLVLSVLLGNLCHAQDFSNKGKDFWVGYGFHSVMTGGNLQEMVLYFAADQNTNVTVNIPGIGYTANYFVAANTVLTSNPIPKNGAQDARLLTESGSAEDKGIHITSDRPIVAYAHIYNQSVSGATILFPTATLGKEYYSVNYTNVSNVNNANCWFYVVACDTGLTTVEITPSENTLTHAKGIPFTVTLRQGQIYNVMGQLLSNGPGVFTGVDLTGSKIQTVNSGSGCKRIGVFSGSGRIALTCNNTAPSSDNYMVQAFPKTAWGKKYLTAPTGGGSPNNIYRICVSTPLANVRINGAPIALPLLNNFFYELPVTSQPMLIESDEQILVAQYMTSQNACGNSGVGDPEVIYLSPVEQNINKVLWNAPNNFNIIEHYINVIVPSGGTALTSFRLDGVPIPPTSFITHPQAPGYSYLTASVVGGQQHTILSDSGFNAIAYGYGNAESYGYNAGTNIKDIYQFVSIQNQYATVNFPATCKNTPFIFSMTFPYQPTRIQWIFNGLFTDVDIASPVPTRTIVVNGRTLYQYELPSPPVYSIGTAGTYPIKVIATNPTPDGCGNEQEIDYDLQVFDRPTASFSFNSTGCVTSPVQFTDNSNTAGRPVVKWHWNFGDATPVGITQNPSHTYAAGGTYTVEHSLITDVGCLSDTARQTITLSNVPVAGFSFAAPQYCAGSTVTFTDASTLAGPSTITKWTWNFGEGPVVVATTNAPQTHTYASPGTYIVRLVVETASGCQSQEVRQTVIIGPNPVADFNLPAVCMPNGAAQFNDLSTIPSGTITGWNWDFGDATTSTLQNPLHNYSGPSPFTVTLTVTSNSGCTNTKTQTLNSVYAEPQPAFTFPAEVCLGSAAAFTDQSIATGSSVAQWAWDFGDGNTSTQQNPSHTYAAAGTYTVTLRVVSAVGCQTVNNTATHTVVVNPLPTVSFNSSAAACQNSIVTLTSTSVANAGTITTYAWTINGTPTGGNNASISFTPTTAGAHTVVLSVTTDKGCTAQTTTSVTVNPKPVANFALPNVCLPAGTANFSSTSTIASGSITGYAWDFGDGNTAAIANPTNTYTTVGPYTVSLTVTSNNGCTDTKSQSLTTIYAEPQAAFNAPAEVCLGTVTNFTDISTAPNSTVTQWAWDFGDGNTSTARNPTHTYATAGSYVVTLSVTSAIGCQTINNIATRTVVINPLPAANFTTSLPGCVTRDITFTDASAANAGTLAKWTWAFGDASSAVLTTGTPFTHVYTAAGSYNVTLQVESSKGCVSTVTTKQVVISVLPKAGFIAPEACLNDVGAQFTDTSSVTPGSITGWQWDFGDANATAGNPNTSNIQNATHHYTAAGSYTATLVAVSNQGCTDTTRRTFFVNGGVPIANFTVLNTTALCSNRSFDIRDASSVDVGSLVKLEIFWDYANDPTIKLVDDDPQPGKNYSHTYPEFGTPATRTYNIRYIAYSGENCFHTFNQTITLLATPSLQFAPVPGVCEDAPAFQVTQAQMTNGLPGTFTYTGNGISATGLFTPSAAAIGPNTITYTFLGSNTCTNSISTTIDVYPKPGINAGPDKVVLEGGSVVLTPAVNAGVQVTYLWSPATGLNNPTLSNPAASPPDDITYTVTVTSDKGCKASDNVFVKVLKKPIIPNIFSPNGDGQHDKWVVPYLESYPGCTIDVVNRYGQLVFHSVGYAQPWDGKVKGKDVPVGTYYYVIDPKNGRAPMTGYVDVIR